MADKYKIKVLQRLDADNFIVETTPYTDPVIPPDPIPVPVPTPPDDHNHDHSSHMVTVTPDYVEHGNERTPRFAKDADCVALKSGNWSDPSIWSIVPGTNSKVQIPEGITVTYSKQSSSQLNCIEISGCLDFSKEVDTLLYCTELMVLPSGCLCIETQRKVQIVFLSSQFRANDTAQAGLGLIVFGEVCISGKQLDKTFVRLAEDVEAGSKVIKLKESVNWNVGDTIFLPDTRDINPCTFSSYYTYSPQYELVTIKDISGSTITLEQSLQFAHKGPKDWDGKPVEVFDEPLYPHAANLSRNIVIRSETSTGTRAHIQLIADAKVSIKYAEFRDLGRTKIGPLDSVTNRIGRYALHCHHLVGPAGGIEGYQFVLQGNAVIGGLKWGIVIHDSHWGLIKDNVVYDIDGAGIAGEAGSERGNQFINNFVCKINGAQTNPPPFNGMGGVSDEIGDLGDGFWFAGPMNTIHDNVVTNVYRNGFMLFPGGVAGVNDRYHKLVQAPSSPGGPMTEYNIIREPFNDFVENEVYGASIAAVQIWDSGNRTQFPSNDPNDVNKLSNTVVWNVNGIGTSLYNADYIEIDGWFQIGDPSMINKAIESGIWVQPSSGEALNHAGAATRESVVKDVDIRCKRAGYIQRGSYLSDRAELTDAYIDTAQGVIIASFAQIPPSGISKSFFNNVTFGDSYSPGSLRAYKMVWIPSSPEDALVPEKHLVHNHQGITGLDLDLFYYEQVPWSTGLYVQPLKPPKGRYAPVSKENIDQVISRSKAMGIDGLAIILGLPVNPVIFVNVMDDYLYYCAFGTSNTLSISIGNVTKTVNTSGKFPLNLPDGEYTIHAKSAEVSVVKKLVLPIKPTVGY